MKTPSVWTNENFLEMEWRYGRLYRLSFPDEKFQLGFDIDYIFESSESGCLVAPCDLQFENVASFKIDANFEMNMLIFINQIRRNGPQKSPNGKFNIWSFEIECDNAMFTFTATGYSMTLRSNPILSETWDIGR